MVDGEKPDVLGGAVEDAAHAGGLARHARQLAVGAVEEVGPHEQEDARHVPQQTLSAAQAPRVVQKTRPRRNAQKDGHDGDGVGAGAEIVEEARPQEAYRAREVYVDIFLCIFTFGVEHSVQ